jgi:hypothetical protein
VIWRYIAVVVWSLEVGACPVAYHGPVHVTLLQGQAYL